VKLWSQRTELFPLR